ncbi:UrcA family protein [Novosphingobium umbonatum]|nr:UrcA family protein [Novosphingobium umbonatum]
MMTKTSSTRFSRTLCVLAFAPLALGLLFAAAAQAMAATEAATDKEEVNTVILRGIMARPDSPKAAKHVLSRIENAALEVCGGGSGSYAEVNRVVRRSDCWRKAVNGAVAQVASPYLPKVAAQ